MKENDKTIKVSKLKNGTVIDHLKPGTAIKALHVLGIEGGNAISIGMYFESEKMGKKDILKIENKELKPHEVNKIALISPNATLSIIENYEVKKKRRAYLPDVIEGIVKCGNPNCITNYENIRTKFYVIKVSNGEIKLRCHYCERVFKKDEVELI